ncbi:MAG TPA: cytochrome C oxidase subunit IV family protein [Terriglobia bacterium]|nr:cytochrome C oxidase subunit IV family protein [Terriglobia bacterium]
MAHSAAHHPTGYKQYFVIWVVLLVMTGAALGVGYAPISESLKAFLLVGTTLAKILVIAAYFMHLRFERMNLVVLTFSPIVLALIMFFFTYGETTGSATHELLVRPAGAIADVAPPAH